MKTLQIMLRHRVAPIKARSATRPGCSMSMCTWVSPTEYDRTPYEALTEKWRSFDQNMAEARSQKEGPLRWSPPTYKNETFLALQNSQIGRKTKSQPLKQLPLKADPQRKQEAFQIFPKLQQQVTSNLREISASQISNVSEVLEREIPPERSQQLTLQTADSIERKTQTKSANEPIIPAQYQEPNLEDYRPEYNAKKKFSKGIGVRKVSFVDEPTTIYYPKNYKKDKTIKRPSDPEQNDSTRQLERTNQEEENVRSDESPQHDLHNYAHVKQFQTFEESGNRMIKESQEKGLLEPATVQLSRLARSKAPSSKHESKRTVSTKTLRRNLDNSSVTNELELKKQQIHKETSQGQNMETKSKQALKKSTSDKIPQVSESKHIAQESQSDDVNIVTTSSAKQTDKDPPLDIQDKTEVENENIPTHTTKPKTSKKLKAKKNQNRTVKVSKTDKLSKEELTYEEHRSKAPKKTAKETIVVEQDQNRGTETEHQSITEIPKPERKNQPIDFVSTEIADRSLHFEDTKTAPVTDKEFLSYESKNVTPINKARKPVKRTRVQEYNDRQNSELIDIDHQVSARNKTETFKPSSTSEGNAVFNRKKYEDLNKYIAEAEVELRVQKQMFNSQRNELKRRLRRMALNPLTEIEKNYKNPFQQVLDNAARKHKIKPSLKRIAKVENSESMLDENENALDSAAHHEETSAVRSSENASLNEQIPLGRTPDDSNVNLGVAKADHLNLETNEINKSNASFNESDITPPPVQADRKALNQKKLHRTNTIDSEKEPKKVSSKALNKSKPEMVNETNFYENHSLEQENSNYFKEEHLLPSAQATSFNVNSKDKRVPKKNSLLFDYYAERQPQPTRLKRSTLSAETFATNPSDIDSGGVGEMTQTKRRMTRTLKRSSETGSNLQAINLGRDVSNSLRGSGVPRASNDLIQQNKIKVAKNTQFLNETSNTDELTGHDKVKLHQHFIDRGNVLKSNKSSTTTSANPDQLESSHDDSFVEQTKPLVHPSTDSMNIEREVEPGTKSLTELGYNSSFAGESKFKVKAKRVQPAIAQPILNEFKKKYPQQRLSKRDYSTPLPTAIHSEDKFATSFPNVNQLINQKNLQRDSLHNVKQTENQSDPTHWKSNDVTDNSSGISSNESYWGQPQDPISGPIYYKGSQQQIKNHGVSIAKSQRTQGQTKASIIDNNSGDGNIKAPLNPRSSASSTVMFDGSQNPDSLHSKKFAESSEKQSLKSAPRQNPGDHNPSREIPVSLQSSSPRNQPSESKSTAVSEEDTRSKTSSIRANSQANENIEELPHLNVYERQISNLTSVGESNHTPPTSKFSQRLVEPVIPAKALNKRPNTNETISSLANPRGDGHLPSFLNAENKLNDSSLNMKFNVKKPAIKSKASLEKITRSEAFSSRKRQESSGNVEMNATSGNTSNVNSDLHPNFEQKPTNKDSLLENIKRDEHESVHDKDSSPPVKQSYAQSLPLSVAQMKLKSDPTVEGKHEEYRENQKSTNPDNTNSIPDEPSFNSLGIKKENEAKSSGLGATKPFISSRLYNLKNALASEQPISKMSRQSSGIREVQQFKSSLGNVKSNNSSFDIAPRSSFARRRPPKAAQHNLPRADSLKTYVGSALVNIKNLDSFFRTDESTHLPGLPIKKWKAPPPTERAVYVASIPQPSNVPLDKNSL